MKHNILNVLLTSTMLAANSICLVGCQNSDVIITRDYKIVLQSSGDNDFSYAWQINEALNAFCGFELPIVTDIVPATEHEIVFDQARSECKDVYSQLHEDEYIIKEYKNKILVVSKSHMARMCAVDHLLTKYASDKGLIVPRGLEVKGYCNASDVVTEIILPEDKPGEFRSIRDAFIVKEGTDDYYLFGTTGWDGIDWRVYHTTGSIKNEWKNEGKVAEKERNFPDIWDELPDHSPQRWAPEVHKYNDTYYMFTTYHSKSSDQRGVTILSSDKITGPYDMISRNERNVTEFSADNHHITYDHATIGPDGQPDGDTIDGTLYVDPSGQPWLVYVNEWVAQSDNIGRFSAVQFKTNTDVPLSEIDEKTNVELFKASDAVWGPPGIQVTDGCFIHTMPSGRLVMTWSADNGHGYSVGYATSDSGITGEWKQHHQQLFTAGMYSGGNVGGGHCMIYEDNGHLFMCMHAEAHDQYRAEHPLIIPVKETPYNTIAWDLYHEN